MSETAQSVADEIAAFTESLKGELMGAVLTDHGSEADRRDAVAKVVSKAGLSLGRHSYRWSKMRTLEKRFESKRSHISKIDDEHQLVFGFFNVAVNKRGDTLVDLQGDVITPDVLEHAAYDYVIESRQGGDMHEGGAVATLVESMVFTPQKMQAMGLDADALPTRWWGGFKIHDTDLFEAVKRGERPMFSIEGEAERVEV